MQKYNKLLVALSGVLAVVSQVLSDGSVEASEGLAVLIAVLTAAGVYSVPNRQ